MIFNMVYGAAAGGVAFDVQISTSLPAVVVDHQVVILTGTEPGTICFSYAAPAEPVSGDIWIHTVDNGGYSLSIAGDQSIFLTPGLVMQYNGSAWEYRNAYIGVNGVWTLFSTNSPLSSCTWEQIAGVANSGEDVSNFWKIGDRKQLQLTDEAHDVAIYDFRHDDIADGSGYAAITFGFTECMNTTYVMNGGSTNAGGWNNCQMRTSRMPAILNMFPAELKNVIKTVNRRVSAGSGSTTITISKDKLFLPTEIEVFGNTNYSAAGEGRKYPIFTTNASRIRKVGGAAAVWWLASPYAYDSSHFVAVAAAGSVTDNYAYNAYGVPPCFCI